MKKLPLILICTLLIGCAAPEQPAAADLPQKTIAEVAAAQESPLPSAEPTESQPTRDESGRPKGENWELTLVEMAVRDLALRLKVDLNTITVAAVESLVWPDSGLGCPLEGLAYAQVETPGYRIRLEVDGESYLYHTDAARAFWLCEDGTPQMPLIPIIPGEIDDGVPWMPVDPVPTAGND